MKCKIYFSSDWHVGHANCLKFDKRPFKDLDEMHETLVKNFNRYVPKHGITYFLGDMGLCSNGLLKSIVDRLNGTKVLVRGNHDGKMDSMYNAGFDVVIEKAQISIGKEIVTMSHCPLRGVFREDVTGMKNSVEGEMWHGESRHKYKYSFEDFGQFHLSGHIHSRPERKQSRREFHRQYDVGVPANEYCPVSISKIQRWISEVLKKENDWRDIPGFSGYKINTFGQIKSFKRYPNGKLIKPYTDKDGYLCASLRKDGGSKAIKVHRAVALAFIPNPKKLPQINHKNCHKKDNEVCNLEWVSNIDNQRHAWLNDRKTVKLTVDNVKLIKQLLKEGISNTEIAKNFNVDQTLISNIKTGKIWKEV